MFLLPAVGAAVCDSLLIIFGTTYPSSSFDGGGGSMTHPFWERVRYLWILAIFRLVLLVGPMTFYSYTGTRLKYPLLWSLFLGLSFVALFLQALMVLLLDPESLASFLSSATTAATISTRGRHAAWMRHVWWCLTLSLGSLIQHVLLFFHVRSTAPPPMTDRRRVLYYYARSQQKQQQQQQQQLYRQNGGGRGGGGTRCLSDPCLQYEEEEGVAGTITTIPIKNYDLEQQRQQQQQQRHTSSSSSPTTDYAHFHDSINSVTSNNNDHDYYSNGATRGRTNSFLDVTNDLFCALPDGYNGFKMEVQTRLQKARGQWRERLEDIKKRFMDSPIAQQQQQQQHQHHGSSTTTTTTTTTTAPGLMNQFLMTPFSVLVQLFAYEDVFTNHKLDLVYEKNEDAFCNYVPQLLSFLLHGAFENSPQLEEWILSKCRSNVHFAHLCFWFLRAWCIGGSSGATPVTAATMATTTTTKTPTPTKDPSHAVDLLDHHYHHHDGDALDDGGDLTFSNFSATTPMRKKWASMSSLADQGSIGSGGKFGPEENSLIEDLLCRVMECGEIPARELQFGPGDEEDYDVVMGDVEQAAAAAATLDLTQHTGTGTKAAATTTSSSPMSNMMVDPNGGVPSMSHLTSVTATRKFGFLPLSDKRYYQREHNQQQPDDQASELFVATPRFLDSLLNIADDLLLSSTPRSQRTVELRRRLQALEKELLPSNVVYMPVNDVHHRVWRISADESIALSTKERVPCIICLEVVDYNHTNSNKSKKQSSKTTTTATAAAAAAAMKRNLLGNLFHNDATTTNNNNSVNGDSNHSSSDTRPNSQNQNNDTPLSPLWRGGPVPAVRGGLGFTSSSTTDSHHHNHHHHHHKSEREVVDLWRTMPRNPHRHNSLFDKVSNYTQSGLRRFRSGGSGGGGKNNNYSLSSNSDALIWRNPSEGELAALDLEVPNIDWKSQQQRQQQQQQTAAVATASPAAPYRANSDPPPLSTSAPAAPSATPTSPPSRVGAGAGYQYMTPPVSPAETMGQWSSLQRANSESAKYGTAKSGTAKSGGGSVVGKKDDDVIHALMDIRQSMEQKTKKDSSSSYYQTSLKGPSGGNGAPLGDQYGATGWNVPTMPVSTGFVESGKPFETRGDEPSALTTTTTATTTATTTQTASPPPFVVFKESWSAKEARLRSKSAHGSHSGWRLLPVLVKSNDDLRQEQLASQLIFRMAAILAKAKVPVWLHPYEIIALTDRGGIIEAIPDTISIDSLKKNDPSYTNLSSFFLNYFGSKGADIYADAKTNFVESLAAYSIVCFLLQIKDRHNGNILLDNQGHIIHIDFGFMFLNSPGKNSGFESAPFKLTREFVDLMDGPDSRTFAKFRDLCYRTFIELRRNCHEIVLLVEMITVGNEDLPCFRGRPDDAVQGLRDRLRLDLNDRACAEYVNSLVDDSLENWRTRWYDRYQRYCVGVL